MRNENSIKYKVGDIIKTKNGRIGKILTIDITGEEMEVLFREVNWLSLNLPYEIIKGEMNETTYT